jgi:hypothetical protein
MRCSQCGLPLSPTRNSCPRCGTPISANLPNQAKVEGPLAQMPFAPQQVPQVPFTSAESWQGLPPSETMQQANMQAAFSIPSPSSSPTSYPTNNFPNRSEPPFAHKPDSSTRDSSKTTRIGLTAAGLCIMVGSLLLILVYLVGQGVLPGGETTTLSVDQQTSTARATQAASVTQAPTSTIPPLTPTPTWPGQNLLNSSVLSNDFNNPQSLTDFKVNQKIYAVLSLRAGSTTHTVCLNWYLNNQLVNAYSSEVNPASNYKYYYWATMQTPGSGYVGVSLASTMSCSNAVLAQKLNFTVTA